MKRVVRALVQPSRRLARPAVGPLKRRIVFWANEGADARFEHVERLLGETRADVEGLERYVPAILNSIAAQNATNRANVRSQEELAHLVTAVLERFQMVRNELLRQGGDGFGALFEPKVVRPDRLPPPGSIRLALGDALVGSPDHLRVDAQALEGTDVLAHPTNLPFDPASVAEIRATHVLERYTPREARLALLPHWTSLLEPGGTLAVVVWDSERTVRDYISGSLSFDDLRDATFGRGDDDAAVRFTMFDRRSVVRLLSEAGLEDVSVRTDPTGTSRDLEVAGRKPAPT
ncbi:MAG: hypothetical protein ACRDV6_02490 [Acidimicrobiales bacterium]